MRVSPLELRAVRADGIVTRYAVLGEAAFILAELPETGSAGTALEAACRLEHWGLVLHGELRLEARRSRTFRPGTAFYVAPGKVHRFRADGPTAVAGFAPVVGEIDDSPEALRARGIEVLGGVLLPPDLPPTVRMDGGGRSAVTGQIETESAVMGRWLTTRSTYGRLSGYAEDWCDLPHWGMILDGSVILHWEHRELELLGPGDVFHSPAGPPGHRIEVPDRATIVDYTPVEAFHQPGRRKAPRTLAAYGAPAASSTPEAISSRWSEPGPADKERVATG
jgi:quercetin dioxygenase-like cupin family protein